MCAKNIFVYRTQVFRGKETRIVQQKERIAYKEYFELAEDLLYDPEIDD